MLPFERKPWAKKVAMAVIVLTLLCAILAPLYLHRIRHLDPPMVVLILLLVLAIVPPNLLIVRRRRQQEQHPPHAAYASRHPSH